MHASPQLFDGSDTRTARPTRAGYVRPRKNVPSRHMTSFQLSADEHATLDRIAAERGVTKAVVLREGLALVAEREATQGASKAA